MGNNLVCVDSGKSKQSLFDRSLIKVVKDLELLTCIGNQTQMTSKTSFTSRYYGTALTNKVLSEGCHFFAAELNCNSNYSSVGISLPFDKLKNRVQNVLW